MGGIPDGAAACYNGAMQWFLILWLGTGQIAILEPGTDQTTCEQDLNHIAKIIPELGAICFRSESTPTIDWLREMLDQEEHP